MGHYARVRKPERAVPDAIRSLRHDINDLAAPSPRLSGSGGVSGAPPVLVVHGESASWSASSGQGVLAVSAAVPAGRSTAHVLAHVSGSVTAPGQPALVVGVAGVRSPALQLVPSGDTWYVCGSAGLSVPVVAGQTVTVALTVQSATSTVTGRDARLDALISYT